MTIHILPIILILEALVILLEQLDIRIMLRCHAKRKDLHAEQHIDADHFVVCQFDGVQGIMCMVELVDAAEQFEPIDHNAKVAPDIFPVLRKLDFQSLIIPICDNEVDVRW